MGKLFSNPDNRFSRIIPILSVWSIPDGAFQPLQFLFRFYGIADFHCNAFNPACAHAPTF